MWTTHLQYVFYLAQMNQGIEQKLMSTLEDINEGLSVNVALLIYDQ